MKETKNDFMKESEIEWVGAKQKILKNFWNEVRRTGRNL